MRRPLRPTDQAHCTIFHPMFSDYGSIYSWERRLLPVCIESKDPRSPFLRADFSHPTPSHWSTGRECTCAEQTTVSVSRTIGACAMAKFRADSAALRVVQRHLTPTAYEHNTVNRPWSGPIHRLWTAIHSNTGVGIRWHRLYHPLPPPLRQSVAAADRTGAAAVAHWRIGTHYCAGMKRLPLQNTGEASP